MLQVASLDPKKWMKHFKSIGIATLAALKSRVPEQFDELSKFAEEEIERSALRKFFGMTDSTKVGYYSYRSFVEAIKLLQLVIS